MKQNNGFILLEAMIASAILIGGLTVVLGALLNNLRVARESQEQYRASLLLEAAVLVREKLSNPDDFPSEDGELGPLQLLDEEVSQGRRWTLQWGNGRKSNHMILFGYGAP